MSRDLALAHIIASDAVGNPIDRDVSPSGEKPGRHRCSRNPRRFLTSHRIAAAVGSGSEGRRPGMMIGTVAIVSGSGTGKRHSGVTGCEVHITKMRP